MKNEIEAMITDITTTTTEAEDYTGEDGRIYHNSGFSRQLAHTLPYSCSVRVTSSD